MAFPATAFALLLSSGPLLGQTLSQPAATTGITDTSQKPPRLLQGPMVGFVSDREARIWVRVNGNHKVQVRYRAVKSEKNGGGLAPRAVSALPENDYTAVIALSGLDPDTAYRYELLINGKEAVGGKSRPARVFRTLPQSRKPGKFRVAFGSCASVDVDPVQRIWWAVSSARPHAFLWLGDNIYGDSGNLSVLRRKYRRQRGVKNLLDFQASVPQLAIWDDHDFGLNDGDRRFSGKGNSLRVFREYWANPGYGLPGTPGVFFRWSIGDVDFFLLDTRTHRDPNRTLDGPDKTHLGTRQKEWLKAELRRSRAVFKVLVASGAWTEGKGGLGDSWGAFLNERDEVFRYIRDHGITGVFLLAGDSHLPRINVIPWSDFGGYDLYEVISSPLAQGVYRGRFLPGGFRPVRPPNAFSKNFGLLEFDTMAEPARVTLRLIGEKGGDLLKPVILTTDDLKPGVRSWDRK